MRVIQVLTQKARRAHQYGQAGEQGGEVAPGTIKSINDIERQIGGVVTLPERDAFECVGRSAISAGLRPE